MGSARLPPSRTHGPAGLDTQCSALLTSAMESSVDDEAMAV